MKHLLLAALLFAATPAPAAGKRKEQEPEPKSESFSSMQMEAQAIMGELKYQHGNLSGAEGTFRDSLNDSRNIAAPTSPVVALDLYRTAELAARRGDYETARQRLDILTSRYAESEYAARGRNLMKMLPKTKGSGASSSAVHAVVTANQPEFLLGRIQAMVNARRDDEALDLCRDFLTRLPTRPEAQEVRLLGAALYLRMGDAKSAERTLRFLADRASDAEVRAKAIHLLAAVELSQGRNDEVVALVPDVDSRRSFSTWISRAQVWRAAAEAGLGKLDLAAERDRRFVDAQVSSPARAYALSELAKDLDRRGDEAGAQKRLDDAADEARRWGMEDLAAGAELSSAHSLYKRQRFAEAAAAYAAFARRHPSSAQKAQALFQQGLALKRLGRREQAVAAFSELVEKIPQSVYAPDAHLQLGQLYTELGASDKAVAAYDHMAQSGEKRGRRESLLMTAQVHYNAKRFKQAIPLYSKFLEENPSDARRSEVEDLLLTSYWLGDRANPDLLKAVERYPKHPIVAHVRWELGAQAYKAGDYASAAGWLERFAADYPKSAHAADSLFYLAEARLSTGDAAAAARAYQAMLVRFPKAPQAAQARMRLAAALDQSGAYAAAAAAYAAVAPHAGAQAPEILLARARALEKAGRAGEALSAYEGWLAKYPRHRKASEIWLLVAEAREKAGTLSASAEAYARVMDEPHRAASLFAAGRLREKLKQTSLAVRNYQALRKTRPANDPSRLHGLVRLGLLYEVLDRPFDAMSADAEVMKLAPRGSADFNAAVKRLQQLTNDGSLVGRR